MYARLLPVLGVAAALCAAQPAQAKDWYVAAGEDGDGTKEKPFDDAQRALDAAAAGDVIHVTQGEYHGKLRVGYWVIDRRGLTLVGGYKDKTFAERNPFKYPTMVKPLAGSKASSFDGSDIRVKHTTGYVDHWSTTIDGFWFDRKEQNGYAPLNAPPDKCPGCLTVPLGSNTKPVLVFEHPDCHIRNNVFMNTALYAVRVTGDGSSIENNLFLNTNYGGIDIFGKGDKLGKGYPFPKILIKNNTFVSAWNCCSLERGAGSFIIHGGNADISVTDNIFHLSNGNNASMGYAIKDERNFKADKWVHLLRNSLSQMRGGMATVYMTDLKASANIDYLKDLRDTPWEVKDNDEENPFYSLDKEWLDHYTLAIPKDDPSSIKVKMDDFNKMRSMLGLPLQAGSVKLGGQYLARYYPVDHVKTGSFFKPTNEKLKGRGIQADGPFAVVKASLAAPGGAAAAPGADPGGAAAPAKEYKAIDWATLWSTGDSLIDQPVKFKCHYAGTDQTFFGMAGSAKKEYLAGATNKTHVIYQLRNPAALQKGEYPIKGFIPLGSAADVYIKKEARRACSDKKADCDSSFMVQGVVKKAGDKVSFGLGPQVVISVDAITAE
jgi:hypothetical protein